MKDRKPFIVLGIAAVALLMLFIFLGKGSQKFEWSENYEAASKGPYGTYVIHKMLKDFYPKKDLINILDGISEELPLGRGIKGNYVFVGESLFLSKDDEDQLLNFVNEGNNAFICSKTIPFDLMFELYSENCNDRGWEDYYGHLDTGVVFNFSHPELNKEKGYKYKFLDENKVKKYDWNFIHSDYFCDESHSMVELGSFDIRRVNFAKKEYGRGTFYIHTTPISFSNIQMLDQVGLEYASKVFSHLEEGDIFWDIPSKQSEGLGRAYNASKGPSGGTRRIASDESLKFILAEPSLSWAWYIAISLGLLYLFFRAKRKQRIIPVLEQNENTSFEFISTIGRLYFLQNDHKKLSLQKMKLFLSYIRDRYNLMTTTTDEKFQARLAAKSEIKPKVIKKIFDSHESIKKTHQISENQLIEFHKQMDEFYKNCK